MYLCSSRNYLLSTINNDSRLLKIVLRTRFHLQLFSITAVKLRHQLDETNMLALIFKFNTKFLKTIQN